MLSDWSIYLTLLYIIRRSKINERLHGMTLKGMLLNARVSSKKKGNNKDPTSINFISLKINLLSPWHSWKIDELALNNNHSLTHSLIPVSSITLARQGTIFTLRRRNNSYIKGLKTYNFRIQSRMWKRSIFTLLTYACFHLSNRGILVWNDSPRKLPWTDQL